LGHVTVAEPGALVGFLGPKVFEALNGVPFPAGVQQAENLAAKGVIDAVVSAEHIPELVDRSLRVLLDPPEPSTLPRRDPTALATRPAWESVGLTRQPGRAGVRDLLRYAATDTLRLRGTDEGERDETVVVALTRLDGQPCVLVGQDRDRQGPGTAMGPAALREARRAMNLAEELRLPLVTVIDTPGAELSVAAEERAVAGEIARCIATMTRMQVPTLAVLLGQGCGGGALALLPARRVLAAQHAWLSPLPPEGASVIVHGDTAHAEEMAARQQIRAVDLAASGTVHRIVPERDTDDARVLARAVAAECAAMLVSMRP
jgi:acetyl-CoA carboxylase carboxyl transferase subunit beta